MKILSSVLIQVVLLYSCASDPPPKLAVSRPSSTSNYSLSGASGVSDGESYDMPMQGKAIYNTEEYDSISENEILNVANKPLSTFSIDVDTASYSNMRRFLRQGYKPPKGAIRTEELVNYFSYQYPKPKQGEAFSVYTEMATTPWNQENLLLHIGLKGKTLQGPKKPLNLVFLLDVSGSMTYANKLPLLKKAFKLLTEQMTAKDKVSIVVYAGASGVVLPPTSGDEKGEILDKLEELEAGGSTNGSAGIELAYQLAQKNFRQDGVNRIILATDGDFNVGVSSRSDLVDLIEEKAKTGIFLTVLGFGMGNYKDATVEQLADKGNGNYAYIDTLQEAKKVLVREMDATLYTIAKDVKIQVEFNPAVIKGYRLIGYENRVLADKDFTDDSKDAGEIGAGHTVTALYELIPVGSKTKVPGKIPLKYQSSKVPTNSEEALTVKLRYKKPKGRKSTQINIPVAYERKSLRASSENFRFATAVASFSMLLRDSKYKKNLSFDKVYVMAKGARGQDRYGYRREFLELVEKAEDLYD